MMPIKVSSRDVISMTETLQLQKGEEMSGSISSNGMCTISGLNPNGKHHQQANKSNKECSFQMPLHYPRYKKSDYEKMPEWQVDCVLNQYGLPVVGDVDQKRKFAMGAFLWPSQNE